MAVHPLVQQAIDAMWSTVGTYTIPGRRAQDDINLIIGALPRLVAAPGTAHTLLAARLGQTFVHPAVVQKLAENGRNYTTVANASTDVYRSWRELHGHDLARTEAPRPGESSTNV